MSRVNEARDGARPQFLARPEQFLEMMPLAGYACDQDGLIVHYNRQAAELWGRRPTLHDPQQRFCGSLRLYWPDGTPLPHAECPMAETLRTGTPVRDGQILIERPDGSRVGALANIEALRNEAGEIVGAINCLREAPIAEAEVTSDDKVTVLAVERQVREQTLRHKPIFLSGSETSEERQARYFHDLLQALPVAIYTTDAAGRITFFNKAATIFSGRVPEIGSDSWCVTWKLYRPDGTPLPHDECPMATALKERRPIDGIEAVAERPDGSRVPFMPYPTPLFDAAGQLTGAVNMLVDLTEIKRSEDLAARLAAIVDWSQDAIVSKTLNGIITSWNRGAEQLFGYTAEEAIGKPVMMLIPSDRSDEERTILEHIRRGQRIETYDTVRRHKDGRLLDVSLTVSPIRNATGRVIGASKIARDISERKRAQAQRELLLREMNHRVKNLFTLTSGMVSLSRRSAQTPDDLARAIQGRLAALSAAHELTLPGFAARGQATSQPTTLAALLQAIVAPYVNPNEGEHRVVLAGPDVATGDHAVTNLALILHEMTTNAAKYGALSAPEGRISVNWSVEDGELRLIWTEQGGPVITNAPEQEGFGSLLARQTVMGLFGGSISQHWHPEGLTVQLTMALDCLTR